MKPIYGDNLRISVDHHRKTIGELLKMVKTMVAKIEELNTRIEVLENENDKA